VAQVWRRPGGRGEGWWRVWQVMGEACWQWQGMCDGRVVGLKHGTDWERGCWELEEWGQGLAVVGKHGWEGPGAARY